MARDVAAPVTKKRFGSASRKAVMMVLAEWCDVDWSTICGQKRIAAESELSERTVRDVLAELEADGLISREKRYGANGYRTSDRTRLNREKILALPAAFAGRDSEAPTTDEKPNDHQEKSDPEAPTETLPAATAGRPRLPAALAATTGSSRRDYRQLSPGIRFSDPVSDPRALPATAAGSRITDTDIRRLAAEKAKAKGARNHGALAAKIFDEDYDLLRAELVDSRAREIAESEIGRCGECDDRGMYEALDDTFYRCTHPGLRDAS